MLYIIDSSSDRKTLETWYCQILWFLNLLLNRRVFDSNSCSTFWRSSLPFMGQRSDKICKGRWSILEFNVFNTFQCLAFYLGQHFNIFFFKFPDCFNSFFINASQEQVRDKSEIKKQIRIYIYIYIDFNQSRVGEPGIWAEHSLFEPS